MASVDRQQRALDVLKHINKAITNLRLYSDQSVQALNTVEKAYSELKSFLRGYKNLCFGLHAGVATLDGIAIDRKGREQLAALTLVDTIAKAGFEGITLNQGLDRKRFKQILSFFTATPEQIQKAGGSAAFVKNAALSDVFLTREEDNKVGEQGASGTFSDCFRQMTAAGVRQEDILSLLRSGQSVQQREEVRAVLQGMEQGAALLAAGICLTLQPLQEKGTLEVSPEFNQLFDSAQLSTDRG